MPKQTLAFEAIIDATTSALRRVVDPIYFRTELIFHAQFYHFLQLVLADRHLLHDRILHSEYQKSDRHGTHQRPDIILHVPAEKTGSGVAANNFVVWALKRRATLAEARADFAKIDEMFQKLSYTFGIFVNIGSHENFAEHYEGIFYDRLRTVAVWPDKDRIRMNWGCPKLY